MPCLEKITLNLIPEKVIKQLHLNKNKDALSIVKELLEIAESLIQLKVFFKVSYISKKGEGIVEIDGQTFSSRVLRKNLDDVERVFPYIITIGKALEDKACSFGDLLKQYCLENIGDMALRSAKQYLVKHLQKQFGLEKLSSMSPGSLPDWPVTEQRPLFSLIGNTEDQIGVRLTDYMLMIPRKSISGILFPTEVTFFSCQLCPRERCPARKAIYDENLKKKYGLADE
ncbi:hypothetical protein LCGC14_0885790 [marine sediment metagenome]|uniref:AdoMet activation domain-containing protein n=1 Tax=marine sediment metagenome TaxID=412755 RepID=A0A0F9P0P4_9ZZZZ|nr:vitamin B12 dependent methionine synthase [Candidatus Aminicenantes bacterium]HEB34950.1 vitamin B12 dependent methionine synthase [Candidatus Aminicenantes bacterium]